MDFYIFCISSFDFGQLKQLFYDLFFSFICLFLQYRSSIRSLCCFRFSFVQILPYLCCLSYKPLSFNPWSEFSSIFSFSFGHLHFFEVCFDLSEPCAIYVLGSKYLNSPFVRRILYFFLILFVIISILV